MYIREFKGTAIWPCIEDNGMGKGMRKLEWHFSNLRFCNDIFPTYEISSGIDPINPYSYCSIVRAECRTQKINSKQQYLREKLFNSQW